jgi:arylsulfatase A-like enzyme
MGGRRTVLRRLLDSAWTYFSLAGVLVIVLLYTQFEVRMPSRSRGSVEDIRSLAQSKDTNLVFILIDTLRADRLHSYGYARETSPVMDHLANTGVRFARTISQSSWTKSSMASLWTGTWPNRNGVTRWTHGIPEVATLPAEIFQQAGFQTAGIWRNGWVAPTFGFQQGFDTYVRPTPGRGPEQFKKKTPSSASVIGTDEDLTLAATEFLRAFGHQRFFLYLHYMDIHQYAYDEASAKFGTAYSDVYDNSIHWVDRNVGALLRVLQDRDLQRKTVIVIAADHGEGFREHGFEGHAKTLYREVAEVPFILSLPFELSPGVVVPQTVANVDIWPTVLDLFGLPPLADADGTSLLPLIEGAGKGESAAFDRPAFAQIDRTWGRPTGDPDPLVAVTQGPFRAMRPLTPGTEPAVEYFDHTNDPWEAKNLAAAKNGGTGALPPELTQTLDDYSNKPPVAWGGPKDVKLDEMELNQLRALGYVIQ